MAAKRLVISRMQAAGAADYIPERPTLPKLRKDVQTCRGCDLYAANSPETRKIAMAIHLSGPPGNCWIARWPAPASTVRWCK